MTARAFKLPLIAACLALLTLATTGAAYAGGCNCTPPPPPPPCNCKPPTPPPPSPPPCCSNINIPGVNVNVGANVVVNTNAQSFAVSGAGAASGSAVYFGGGGGYWSMGEGASGLIQGLNVESAAPRRVAYEATRTRIRVVIIQAVCIDDKEIPHPASQVTPDREIDEHYEGELYRCIAGTHMQATIADYHGLVSFEHGQIITCAKGEALYRSASGEIACRRQIPARDCNERSLLRRYGAGVKIVKIVTVERYTAYREEMSRSATMSNFNMTIDGGVGGVVR